MDSFRRYAHAQVITDLKNMGLSWRANTEGFWKGENEDKNDCHKTTRDSWEEINAGKRKRNAGKRHWIETQNKLVDILFALKLLRILCIKRRRGRI